MPMRQNIKNILTASAAVCFVSVVSAPNSVQGVAEYVPGHIFKDCDGCPSMIVVPAGAFTMGSPEAEKGRTNLRVKEEQHRVEIKKPFAIGRFEITVGQFRKFLTETSYEIGNECFFPQVRGGVKFNSRYSFEAPGFKQTDSHPAVCISWNDAQAYLTWLTKKTGHTYRLPTESEWEYAARAGSTTPYWWGATLTTDKANYIEAHYGQDLDDPNKFHASATMPVDSFSPNKFGLYNVHGNVMEWTQDCWHGWEAGYRGHPGDGSAWLSKNGGDCNLRIARDGGWSSIPQVLRLANRDRAGVDMRANAHGFRAVRDLSE